MAIDLPDEFQKRAVESIKRHFEEALEMEIGDLQSRLLLDFFLEELAPSVYNEAIRDAQAFMQDRVGDLEASCYKMEFDHWKDTR